MKSLPPNKAHSALQRPLASIAVLCACFACACHTPPDTHEHPTAHLQAAAHDPSAPDAPLGDGALVIHNHSQHAITRVWLSPRNADTLEIGASPDDFDAIEAHRHATIHTPAGWWNLWLEADNGHDALLYHTWIAPDDPTTLHIDDSWWARGDWIQFESRDEEGAQKP